MITLVLMMLIAGKPEHEFEEYLDWPEIKLPDNRCDCLEWKQVDGGYVCSRPYCPAPKKKRGDK